MSWRDPLHPGQIFDGLMKTLAQILNAFGSVFYPGTSPSPKGLRDDYIFFSQNVSSGGRLMGDYWSCLRGFTIVKTEYSEAEPHFGSSFSRMLQCVWGGESWRR